MCTIYRLRIREVVSQRKIQCTEPCCASTRQSSQDAASTVSKPASTYVSSLREELIELTRYSTSSSKESSKKGLFCLLAFFVSCAAIALVSSCIAIAYFVVIGCMMF